MSWETFDGLDKTMTALRAERDRLQAANAQMREVIAFHIACECGACSVKTNNSVSEPCILATLDTSHGLPPCAKTHHLRAVLAQDGSEWLAERKADKARIAELEKGLGIAADFIERQWGAASAMMYQEILLKR